MSGQDSKSKKDKSAVTSETWTDASMNSKEEKAYQLTKEEKIVATSPPYAITTGEDMTSDQNEKRTVTTDLTSSSNTSPDVEKWVTKHSATARLHNGQIARRSERKCTEGR
jgi:hypothetical protein